MFNESTYLQELVDNQEKVLLYLMNGFQLRGKILNVGQEAILFYCEGTEQLIFKHVISTVKRMSMNI